MHYCLVVIILVASMKLAAAEEWVVDLSSCSAENTFCEIQEAIDAASDNDVILLKNGDYELWQQSITIKKSITLQGQSKDKTLLLGEGNAPSALLIVTPKAETVVLKNLTVADRVVAGSPTMGPGGMDYRGGDLVMENVVFKNNRGGWGGAARIISLFATIEIKNSHFIDNTGFAGGGLAVYDGNALELIIEGSHFSGNNAVFSGGAILMRDVAEVRLDAVEIQGNTAGNTGGGVHAFTDTGTVDLTVVGSTINNNEASKVGGLSTKGEDIAVTLQDSKLQDNRSRDSLPGMDCGGAPFELLGNNIIGQSDRCQ